ncbi:MAG: symmetrical bis(5'-nucleosyl)-tetraphosphatase [Oleiphilaceae bacterium]|nr:symmetrical bis(5'-nucleosyl)-tetraphosphatase [Oleiphilaceae bacterium]
MTTYVIGDLQGCYERLTCLLETLRYSPSRDEIWLAGDLVNRGPESLACLTWAREHAARVVLGNHDLHLLALYYSFNEPQKSSDTLEEILGAPNVNELMEWLRVQPVLHYDSVRELCLVHAGIPHIWSVARARELASELHACLKGDDYHSFFSGMYGNRPACWSEELQGQERLRVVTNYFTRMRFVTEDGTLDFAAKEGLDAAPPGFAPWFHYARNDHTRIVFGHWAALQGQTGNDQFWATDTGCVWGGALTAIDVDTGERIHCEC